MSSERCRVVIAGAGGHAKVIIDILQENEEFELAGCTTPGAGQREVLGLTVLGSDDILPELFRSGVQHAFVALGDNRARLSVAQRLADSGFRLVNAVSRRAVVSRHVRLGMGVAIMPGAVVNVDAVLEDGAIVNTGASIDHDCRIGRYAHIAPGCSLAGNVTIGEGTLLGAGSSVIPGRSVGPWSIIGAGAVVTANLPGQITAVGVPARVVKRQDISA